MNVAGLGCALPKATTTHRCHRVPCTPDVISTPTTSYSPAVERPISKQQVSSPISQLAAVQDPPVVWPSQQAPQIERVTHIHPAQQQYAQDTLQQAAVLSAPAAGHSQGSTGPSSSALDTTAAAGTTTTSTTPRKQRRKRHKQHSHMPESSHVQQPGSLLMPAASQKAPLKYAPCGKRDGQQLAASVSKQLRRGHQVLLPAGAGMQLVRTTAMLSSARSLLLSRNSSTGLVFQPSLSTAAGAAAMQAHQQQRQQQQQDAWAAVATAMRSSPVPPQQLQYLPSGSASSQRASGSSGTSTSGRTTKGSSKGVMLLVAAVSEAQLRRFDQHPLIAARSTRAAALAAAIFARLCKRGFTSVRAAGPEATRLAMLAAAEARSKLLGCGLDLAVVPATELVDVDSLGDFEGAGSQYVEVEGTEGGQEGVGPGEELPKQFVRVTVLHLVRCEPQQPGRLLPWPVPAEQLPAVRHAQQQQEGQQQCLLGQQLAAQQVQAEEPQQLQQSQQLQQQRLGDWGSLQLAAVQQAQQQHPSSPPGQQEPQSAPVELTPLLVGSNGSSSHMGSNGHSVGHQRAPLQELGTLQTNGSSSSSSSVPLLPRAANGAAPSPLLLPPQRSGTAVGWTGASSAFDGSQPEQLLLDADQLQALQLQQLDGSDLPPSAGLGPGAPASPSQGGGSIARQPGGLLLQHKQALSKKGSRQLVAAAQAGNGTASRGSSS